MNQRKDMKKGRERTYWRSLNDLEQTSAWAESVEREFPEGADELEVGAEGMNRRAFMGLVGASTALAGFASGCIRKPAQYILPYVNRPEELLPGEVRYYATSFPAAGDVQGFLVASNDGRPTKIEGNPRHPNNAGATSAIAQARILELYDPNRARGASIGGSPATLDAALDAVRGLSGRVGVLVSHTDSPTLNALLGSLSGAQLFGWGADLEANARAGAAMVAPGMRSYGDTTQARVLVALDADPIGSGANHIAHARGFAAGRAGGDASRMNRLYAVEPGFTVTGMSADNRLQLASSQVGAFTKALAKYIFDNGARTPSGAQSAVSALASASAPAGTETWVSALGDDLLANREASAIFVGERQPAWVHALGHLINDALGNTGKGVAYRAAAAPTLGSLDALASAAGQLDALVILGGNPLHEAPGDVDVAGLLGSIGTTVHLAFRANETTAACDVHVPMSHPLESWGDWQAANGVESLQQPLIEPLFPSVSEIELVSVMQGGDADGRERVRTQRRRGAGGDFDAMWDGWLHEGGIVLQAQAVAPSFSWGALASAMGDAPSAPSASAPEIIFALDSKLYDGRFANVPWLQELPDPVTKLTWDNAALIGPHTARAMGIPFDVAFEGANDILRPADAEATESDIPITPRGQLVTKMVTITANGRSVTLAAMVVPGVAEHCVILPMGYGYTTGVAAHGPGFHVEPLRDSSAMHFASGTVAVQSETYVLATTQDHNAVEGRAIYREATASEYAENPAFVEDYEIMPAYKLRSLWDTGETGEMYWESDERYGRQQWGMSIDLTTCTSCNACTVACQAENNISVVGKQRVLEGREMHWIRLDRYFAGDAANPEVAVQPVACMHCENAPCEQVCPVAATVHGPEGTNDMAYNRCIGTRYCANNCPYKVRRFNFFNFSRENDERNPLYRLQKNPQVTVRFRGVIEKCSYCMQRIQAAKIEAKRSTPEGLVPDGAITPACAQVCPTRSIVFGDIADDSSRVSQAKRDPRTYGMLAWTNSHPRTTYLARVTNPNPALVEA